MKILLAGGGTGGHILPTLAVAKALKDKLPGVELLYVGSKKPEDRRLVESAGIAFRAISTGKLRRYLSWENLRDIFWFWLGIWEAGRIVRKFSPAVVFAKGGYVSLPVVIAAHKLNIPVVLHESDSHLGLANRMALKTATKIAVAWPIQTYWQTATNLGKFADKFIYTGLPIGDDLLNFHGERLFNSDKPIILVTGGSQGAQAINDAVWASLSQLLRNYNVVHQTGTLGFARAEQVKADLAPELTSGYLPFGFDRKMILAGLHQADVVVSRAGSSVFELGALKKVAVLVPLAGSANDHQRKNAESLVKAGMAVMIAPELLTSEVLINTLRDLMMDNEKRQRLSAKMGEFGQASRQAAEVIAKLIIETARG